MVGAQELHAPGPGQLPDEAAWTGSFLLRPQGRRQPLSLSSPRSLHVSFQGFHGPLDRSSSPLEVSAASSPAIPSCLPCIPSPHPLPGDLRVSFPPSYLLPVCLQLSAFCFLSFSQNLPGIPTDQSKMTN